MILNHTVRILLTLVDQNLNIITSVTLLDTRNVERHRSNTIYAISTWSVGINHFIKTLLINRTVTKCRVNLMTCDCQRQCTTSSIQCNCCGSRRSVMHSEDNIVEVEVSCISCTQVLCDNTNIIGINYYFLRLCLCQRNNPVTIVAISTSADFHPLLISTTSYRQIALCQQVVNETIFLHLSIRNI